MFPKVWTDWGLKHMWGVEGRSFLKMGKYHLMKSCGETTLMFSTHSVPAINTKPAVYGPPSAEKDGKMTCGVLAGVLCHLDYWVTETSIQDKKKNDFKWKWRKIEGKMPKISKTLIWMIHLIHFIYKLSIFCQCCLKVTQKTSVSECLKNSYFCYSDVSVDLI